MELAAEAAGSAGLPGTSSRMPAAEDAGEEPTAFRARTLTEYAERDFSPVSVADVPVVLNVLTTAPPLDTRTS